MLTLSELQTEAAEWRAVNFPDNNAWHQLVGMVEEMGELSHAFLKFSQGIRGMSGEAAHAKMTDAIGDLFIFASGFCTYTGIDLAAAVEDTWEEVKQRDWVANRETGQTPGA